MTCVGFLILLSTCMLFSCEGGITSPAEGTEFVFLPKSTLNLTWTFDDDVSTLSLRAWGFTRSGGSTELIASIFQDTQPVPEQSSLSEVKIVKPATLLLKNVNQSYDGVYRFEIVFKSRLSVSIDVRVYIAKKPTATVNCSSRIILNEGDSVTCVCSGKGGNPPANITWFKDGVQLDETEKLNNTLTLINVNGATNGTYKCEARSHTNDSFKDEESVELGVNFKPIIKSFTSDPVQPIHGYQVTLKCESDGLPEPHYMIKFENGSVASATNKYDISVMRSSDVGIYTCIAKNIKGNDSATLNLTGQGPATYPLPTAATSTSKASHEIKTTTKCDESVPASSNDSSAPKWYIVMVILSSGIIIGIMLSYIFLRFRRRWLKGRNTERDPEPKTTEVNPTYQELDLTKMNTEDNYQSLGINAASNEAGYDNDSTYTDLNKASRNDENNYQSLT